MINAGASLGSDPYAPTDTHPKVLSAVAARDRARYNLGLNTVLAPADGVVYQATSFREGQYILAGVLLFSLVETGGEWIDAIFKETQIANIVSGQPAEIVFDIYPGKRIPATVSGIGAGTGAEFSLLPAQNATGNWVKVSQRIPVRLKLDSLDPSIDLRSGMSATVTVDTGVTRSLSGIVSGK